MGAKRTNAAEWAAIAKEAESKKDWATAVDAYQEAASLAVGDPELHPALLANLWRCESKRCQSERATFQPSAPQTWLGEKEVEAESTP